MWRRGSSLLAWVVFYTEAFNIDVEHAVMTSYPQDDSLYGYSIHLLKGQSSELFIGAPLQRENNIKTGGVHRCRLDLEAGRSDCSQLILADSFDGEEEREGQLLGVDLAVTDSTLYTCAPRRQFRRQMEGSKLPYVAMQGKCWNYSLENQVSNAGQNFLYKYKELGGRDGHTDGSYLYGTLYSSVGMALHHVQAGPRGREEIIYGAPGTFSWTGTLVKDGNPGVLGQPWSRDEPRNDDYTGYSIASGRFGGVVRYVVGAPRAGINRTGQVFVVDFEEETGRRDTKLTLYQKLEGSQFGEYFGAAVAVADLNGDGKDDIIVGSPLYTYFAASEPRAKRDLTSTITKKENYEEGRISVFLSGLAAWAVEEKQLAASRLGLRRGSRYGSGIANLGDITGDECDEIAVGAPGHADGEGMLVILRGSASGELLVHQLIKALSFRGPIRSLGTAVATALDLDGNGYNDLAVSAAGSATVLVLRTHPVIDFEGRLTFDPAVITLTSMRNFTVRACAKVIARRSGRQILRDISTKFQITLDKKIEFFGHFSGQKWEGERRLAVGGAEACVEQDVRASSTFSYMQPATASLLITQVVEKTTKFCKECGKADPDLRYQYYAQVDFHKDCGGSLCRSDLNINAAILESDDNLYVIGQTKKLTLEVEVTNIRGDPAYRPVLTIKLPKLLKLLRDIKDCSREEAGEILILVCNLPGPIQVGNRVSKATVDLDPRGLVAGMTQLKFDVDVRSETNDLDAQNDRKALILYLRSEVDLEMVGGSVPEQRFFGATGTLVDRSFNHIFQVRNVEKSPVLGVFTVADVPVGFKRPDKTILVAGDVTGRLLLPGLADQPCDVSPIPTRSFPGAMPQDLICGSEGVVCQRVSCPSFDLPSQDTIAGIQITGWMNLDTLQDLDTFSLTSNASLKVPGLEESLLLPQDRRPNSASFTSSFQRMDVSTTGVAAWQIVVSVVGGLVVLLLLILLLVRCNFFKRKPVPVPENEWVDPTAAGNQQAATVQSSAEMQPMIEQSDVDK